MKKHLAIIFGMMLILINLELVIAADYYRVNSGSCRIIYEWHIFKYVCNNCAHDIFVPTKTEAEWQSFINNHPSCITFKKVTLMYVTTGSHNGDFDHDSALRSCGCTNGDGNARCELDCFCKQHKPTTVPSSCSNIHAFISVSSSDEIRDMPSNYGYDSSAPIYWIHRSNSGQFTKLANNWQDMLDGSIEATQAAGTGDACEVWTGSQSDGEVQDPVVTCAGWAWCWGPGIWGQPGEGTTVGSAWIISQQRLECDSTAGVRCTCQP